MTEDDIIGPNAVAWDISHPQQSARNMQAPGHGIATVHPAGAPL